MKKQTISIIAVLLFLVYLVVTSKTFDEARCEYLKRFLSIQFSGVVQNKYIDSSEHSYPTIIVKDRYLNKTIKLNLLYDTTDLFNLLNIGDSVSKLESENLIKVITIQNNIFMKKVDFGCDSKNSKKEVQ